MSALPPRFPKEQPVKPHWTLHQPYRNIQPWYHGTTLFRFWPRTLVFSTTNPRASLWSLKTHEPRRKLWFLAVRFGFCKIGWKVEHGIVDILGLDVRVLQDMGELHNTTLGFQFASRKRCFREMYRCFVSFYSFRFTSKSAKINIWCLGGNVTRKYGKDCTMHKQITVCKEEAR